MTGSDGNAAWFIPQQLQHDFQAVPLLLTCILASIASMTV